MFCDASELPQCRQIVKLIGKAIPLETNHPFHTELTHYIPVKKSLSTPKKKKKYYPRKR